MHIKLKLTKALDKIEEYRISNIFFPQYQQLILYTLWVQTTSFQRLCTLKIRKKKIVQSGRVVRETENHLYLQKFSIHQNNRGLGDRNAVTFVKP